MGEDGFAFEVGPVVEDVAEVVGSGSLGGVRDGGGSW